MDLSELVRAIVTGDLLKARQWVADAYRRDVVWMLLERPNGLNDQELTIAAGVVELLAIRRRATAPAWVFTVGASHESIVLDPGLEKMPRSFERAKMSGPEPLRRRNLVALPDFLNVA
jgi:hypothetical protein